MFPTLTFSPKAGRSRRALFSVAGGALLVAAIALSLFASSSGGSSTPPPTLVDRLSPSTWALAIPVAWLAAPVPDVRAGERVDVIAVRTGDHPLAIPLAADLRVMSADESSIVFEVDEDAATAIASARASSLLMVPLLRSSR